MSTTTTTSGSRIALVAAAAAGGAALVTWYFMKSGPVQVKDEAESNSEERSSLSPVKRSTPARRKSFPRVVTPSGKTSRQLVDEEQLRRQEEERAVDVRESLVRRASIQR